MAHCAIVAHAIPQVRQSFASICSNINAFTDRFSDNSEFKVLDV